MKGVVVGAAGGGWWEGREGCEPSVAIKRAAFSKWQSGKWFEMKWDLCLITIVSRVGGLMKPAHPISNPPPRLTGSPFSLGSTTPGAPAKFPPPST